MSELLLIAAKLHNTLVVYNCLSSALDWKTPNIDALLEESNKIIYSAHAAESKKPKNNICTKKLTTSDPLGRQMIWSLYSVGFESPDGKFSFEIYAISDDHAQLQVDAIRETAKLDGQILSKQAGS
jgi:hypothetical protein